MKVLCICLYVASLTYTVSVCWLHSILLHDSSHIQASSGVHYIWIYVLGVIINFTIIAVCMHIILAQHKLTSTYKSRCRACRKCSLHSSCSPAMLAALLLLLCASNCVWLSVAISYSSCQSLPGLPGRDGRDGRDGVPGPAGPPGTPGHCEVSEHTNFLNLSTKSQTCNLPIQTYWMRPLVTVSFYFGSVIVTQVVVPVMVEGVTVQFCTRGYWQQEHCKNLGLFRTWSTSLTEKYISLQASCTAVLSDLL